jgi:hypothetical protein
MLLVLVVQDYGQFLLQEVHTLQYLQAPFSVCF